MKRYVGLIVTILLMIATPTLAQLEPSGGNDNTLSGSNSSNTLSASGSDTNVLSPSSPTHEANSGKNTVENAVSDSLAPSTDVTREVDLVEADVQASPDVSSFLAQWVIPIGFILVVFVLILRRILADDDPRKSQKKKNYVSSGVSASDDFWSEYDPDES